MGRKSLGIDIGDSWITGVVIEQQRKSLAITTCLRVPLPENADAAQQIRLLCQQIGWRQEDCVCGLPLSLLSVRNLSLPFRDTNKIAQALPFELEEQLIVPIDTLIVDFSLVEATDSGGRIVAFVAEKKFLSGLLAGLQGTVDPLCITPSIASLAVQVARHHRHRQDFLLVSADFHSITLALIGGDTPVFYRRLSYPEEMILHPPFFFVEDEVVMGDRQAVEQCVRLFCASMERSLDYYYLESGSKRRPDRVVLTGPLAEVESLAAMIAAALNLPVETPELLPVAGTDTPKDETMAPWRTRRFDGALSLAMLGLKRKYALNFRKDDFAIKRKVFSSRKQMVATGVATALVAIVLLGFVWYDYRHLQYRDRELREEMTAIFRQTFPAVTTVHEPYIEMLAALKNIESSDSPTPLFAADKRVLALLADISARIPEAVDLRVSRLVIDRESVLIRGTTDTFNAVDTMKNSLAASPRYRSVQIVSATADMARNTSIIRFEIQLRLVEV
jgi:general secretion pathway protein L